MAKHTGTPKGIQVWFRSLMTTDESRVELVAVALEGPQLVTEWSKSEVVRDLEAWSNQVDELALNDAQARDLTTRYELRHLVGDRMRGVFHLRRVVERDPEESSQMHMGPAHDAAGMIRQLSLSLERAHAQVIDSARVATSTANAAIASQQAALATLAQSYLLIERLQDRIRVQEPEPEAPKPPSAGDVAFQEVIKQVTPMLVGKLMASATSEAAE